MVVTSAGAGPVPQAMQYAPQQHPMQQQAVQQQAIPQQAVPQQAVPQQQPPVQQQRMAASSAMANAPNRNITLQKVLTALRASQNPEQKKQILNVIKVCRLLSTAAQTSGGAA